MTVNYGIVGSGRMGTYHAEQLLKLDDARVVAVCDENVATAERLARTSDARAYSSYAEMLDNESLDAIYLCTPVRGRLQQLREITSRRIPVYIEKPLATSIEEAREMVDLVEQSGALCTIGLQWRSKDFVKTARQIAGEDPISLLVGRYYWTVPLVEWIQTRYLGGGQIFDQNIHMVDLALYFAGAIGQVYSAFTQKVTVGEMDNWDGYSTTAVFENGTVGNFYSTYGLYAECGEDPFLDIVQRNRLLRITDGELIVKTPGKVEVFKTQEAIPGICHDFHRAVREDDPDRILAPIAEGFRTLKTVLAATSSAVRNQVVHLSEFDNFGLDDLRELAARHE